MNRTADRQWHYLPTYERCYTGNETVKYINISERDFKFVLLISRENEKNERKYKRMHVNIKHKTLSSWVFQLKF